jgi:hypothetical protein
MQPPKKNGTYFYYPDDMKEPLKVAAAIARMTLSNLTTTVMERHLIGMGLMRDRPIEQAAELMNPNRELA